MARKIEVEASVISSATPDDIYSLVANSATYPLWSMIEYYQSLRPGPDGIDSVGSRRLFRTGRAVMHEEIVDRIPNISVGYTLLSGFPLLEYRADTILETLPAGTRIIWKSSFYPKYPITGWFWRALMTWVFKRMVRSLARTAEDPERRLKMLAIAQGGAMAKTALAQI
jgi:hypothetical protein